MRKVTLKRRELIALLEHNGFISLGRGPTSHVRYRGVIDGKTRLVSIDEAINDNGPGSHTVLYYIVSTQHQFFGPDSGAAKAGWTRFFGGEPGVALRAQVPYRKW